MQPSRPPTWAGSIYLLKKRPQHREIKRKKYPNRVRSADRVQICSHRIRHARRASPLRLSHISHHTSNSPHTSPSSPSLTHVVDTTLDCIVLNLFSKDPRVSCGRIDCCTQQHPPSYSTLQDGNTNQHISKDTLSSLFNHHLPLFLSSPLSALPSPRCSPHTFVQLITDLPEESMQIVLSWLGPKDIVFWSWVDTNCHRKVLRHPFLSLPSPLFLSLLLSPILSPLPLSFPLSSSSSSSSFSSSPSTPLPS